MINFKIQSIDQSAYQKVFFEHNQGIKDESSQITFNETELFFLLDQFYESLNDNDFTLLEQTIKSLIQMNQTENPAILLKIKEYNNLHFIDTVMELLINPPQHNQIPLYLNLFISLLYLKTSEITQYIIQNSEYIEYFDSDLFQINQPDFLIETLNIIGAISDDLTTLNIRFCKLFQSFTFDIIFNLFGLIEDPDGKYYLIKTASKICTSIRYGEFYSQLISFILDCYQLSYHPFYLFDNLIQYIKNYPSDAYKKLVENGFIYGRENQKSVFDFLSQETFSEQKYLFYYEYCYYSFKFINVLIKAKCDMKSEILKCLPVDDVCSIIFDEDAPIDVINIALKILIADCFRDKNEDDPDDEEGRSKFIENNYILSHFYDHIKDNEKVYALFDKGNFKLKYRMLRMVEMTIQSFLYNESESKNDDNDVVLKLLEPTFIQIVSDMLLSDNEKLANLVVDFLDVLLAKAISLQFDRLIEIISTDSLVDSLIQFIDESEYSVTAENAKHILSIIKNEEE